MLKKIRKIIMPFIVLLLCVCALSFKDEKKVFAAQLNGTPVESSYAINSSFRADKTSMNIDGTNVEITGRKIYFPNNTVSTKEEVSLVHAGRYTVEYTATYQGKTYVLTETFEVYDALYSFTSLSDIAEYGANPYDADSQGLNVSLLQGSTFYFNPIIDFSDKTKEDEMISLNITPERLGVADFGRLFIRLTDVYDENNYVTISVNNYPEAWANGVAYITAGAANQPQVGIENVDNPEKTSIKINDIYGYGTDRRIVPYTSGLYEKATMVFADDVSEYLEDDFLENDLDDVEEHLPGVYDL